MFKQFIDKINGADLPMIISLLIFFLFFILLWGYLIMMDKQHIKYMLELPLQENDEIN